MDKEIIKSKKKYIFVTANIHSMGGMQNYVKSKAEYLCENNWEVYILFLGNKEKGCAFPKLDEYVNGGMATLHIPPETIYGTTYYWSIINEMLDIVGFEKNSQCEYLIESQAEYEAVWGEIFAEVLGAKHFCFICNERFRGVDKHYIEYMDFFKWKFARNEIAGIANHSLKMLFQDYMEVESSDRYKLVAATKDNVSYIKSEIVDCLPKKEWNIAYLGRCEKDYFPIIVEEIGALAQKYDNKNIQFVVVGPMGRLQEALLEKLDELENITVSCLGSFSIIPKQLFDKMDVVVAGSGCALLSAKQEIPTIVADAKTYQACGIYGYTTDEYIFGNTMYSYLELLEDVLIYKTYLDVEKPKIQILGLEEAYKQFFEYIGKSESLMKYYRFDFMDKSDKIIPNNLIGIRHFLTHLSTNKKEMEQFLKWLTSSYGEKIGLFGIGKVGELIIRNIPKLNFSKLYDNSRFHCEDKMIQKPTLENLVGITTIIISPIEKYEEMIIQLQQEGFDGEIIKFIDIIDSYIKTKLINGGIYE